MDCQGQGLCLEKRSCCDCFINCDCKCNDNCIKEYNYDYGYGHGYECIKHNCTCCQHIDNCHYNNEIHKNCQEYCLIPINCQYECKLQKCNNYNLCNNKASQFCIESTLGFCSVYCDMQYGRLIFLEDIKECAICFENKNMVKLLCNHEFCKDCIKTICLDDYINKCPLCRNILYKNPKKN